MYYPCSLFQRKMGLNLYVTQETDPKYCDEPHVKLFGNKWSVELLLSLKENDRSISYIMRFGIIGIDVTVTNTGTGEIYETNYDLDI